MELPISIQEFPPDQVSEGCEIKLDPSSQLLEKYLKYAGLVGYRQDAYDQALKKMWQIIHSTTIELPNKSILGFQGEYYAQPELNLSRVKIPLTPAIARDNYTYDLQLQTHMYLRHIDGKEQVSPRISVGSIPLMLGSQHCYLKGQTEQQLRGEGEDPNDPLGYFIIKGREKTLPLKEMLRTNKILVFHNKQTECRMTCASPRGTQIVLLRINKKGSFKLILNGFMTSTKANKKNSIGVFQMFRLLGMTEYDDIIGMVRMFVPPEHIRKIMAILAVSLGKLKRVGDDIQYMEKRMGASIKSSEAQKKARDDKKKKNKDKEEKKITIEERLNAVIEKELFPHLNEEDPGVVKRLKIYLLMMMVTRLAEYLIGVRKMDDRDSWSNKRLNTDGGMTLKLFSYAWNTMIAKLKEHVTSTRSLNFESLYNRVDGNIVKTIVLDSYAGAKWTTSKCSAEPNVVQELKRNSPLDTLAHLSIIDVKTSRNDKQTSIRMAQDTQYGFVDIVETPDGESTGIVKHMAITCSVSLEQSESTLRVELQPFISNRYTVSQQSKLVINGKFLGFVDGPNTLNLVRKLRRERRIGDQTEAVLDPVDTTLYVYSDEGRVIRPLLVVNDETGQLIIDEIKGWNLGWHDLLLAGAVEYISSWEQEYTNIAFKPEDVRKAPPLESTNTSEKTQDQIKRWRYSHCEIDQSALLGFAASTIPYPEHNQSPRNVFQCGMIKQALGIFHANYQNRMDGTMKNLAYPGRPIFEPHMNKMTGLNALPSGQMVNVAISTFMGYSQEDAFIFNKGAIDRGLFTYTVWKVYDASIESKAYVQQFARPPVRAGDNQGRYDAIEDDGLPRIGAYLREGQCVIGRIRIGKNGETIDDSIYLDAGEEGRVDVVIQDKNIKNEDIIKVRLRWTRKPQSGDKFAPRYAQKGTIGIVIPEEDMPFSTNLRAAPRPDVIINPHCFTADTPVLLENGLMKPLVSMNYDGGNKVWSLDKDKYEFVTSEAMGYESKGIKDIVKVTLSDGRIIRCTPDHRFPIIRKDGKLCIKEDVPISKVTKDMFLLATIDGILDAPTKEEREIELKWKLDTDEYTFDMNTDEDREKSLAFARLIGLICTDGCLSISKDGVRGNVTVGSVIDINVVLDDIELVTGKRPAITPHDSERGSVLTIALPLKLARSAGSLECINIGRKTSDPKLPSFLFDEKCPKSIIREFLGGLFGGDGWAPYLVTNKQDGQGTVTFNSPAISQSSTVELQDKLIEKMKDIKKLLERIGVEGARVDKPKLYKTGDRNMVTCTLQLPRSTEFGDKVGFRYCIQKMYRQAAYQSYMRYLENVKRQNDFVIQRSSELYDKGEVGHSLTKALEKAREELFISEAPLNEYYSNGTLDQVRNRRRKDRFKELIKWDYEHIEDADRYLHKIGAYHWFRTEEGTGGADYIVKQDATSTPYFYLQLHDIRCVGKEEVFDLGIHVTHTLTVNGIAANNCVPSRMTISYLFELIASKAGVMSGERINATAFRSFDLKHFEEVLWNYGFHRHGYDKMINGLTGEPIDTLIYRGPAHFQALRHHVLDKYQMRHRGTVKIGTHLPAGQKRRRGLRLGEMERDAVISHGATKFLQERLMKASSGYEAVFCRTCGTIAIVDALSHNVKCKRCGDKAQFGRCEIPMTWRMMTHYLNGLGFKLSVKLVSPEDRSVVRRRQIAQKSRTHIASASDVQELLKEDEEPQEEGYDEDFAEI